MKYKDYMKAIFVHDHYFVEDADKGIYYDGSGGSFTAYMWNRYLAVFDKLTVIGRKKESLPNKLIISSADNVDFYLIDDIQRSVDKILKAKNVREKLSEKIKEVDYVICRVPSTLGYWAIDECKAQKKKYLMEVVGCPFDAYWNYGGIITKFIAPLQWLKLRRYARNSLYTVYVTQKFLQKRYPTKNESIGISNVNLNSIVNIDSALEFYKNDFTIFNIGLIGSFHVKYKGHKEALKALKKNVDNGVTQIKLHLVGSGDYSWVKELAEDMGVSQYVNFVGLLEAGEKGILPFLDSLHLYIHPSKQEGLPRVVLEAMSRGKLVLGASVAGVPELIDNEFLHTPGDWKKLAEQISHIYENRKNWDSIVKNNLNVVADYTENILQTNRVNFIKKSI